MAEARVTAPPKLPLSKVKKESQITVENVRALSDGDEIPETTSTMRAVHQATIDAQPELLEYLDRDIDSYLPRQVVGEGKSIFDQKRDS